jgi:hypothetical protein
MCCALNRPGHGGESRRCPGHQPGWPRNPLRVLLFGFLLALPGISRSQSAQNLVVHGPSSNCFNIVFLSEGYTSSQLSGFLSDATNALRTMLLSQPFQEYSNYINGYAISVASANSGSDHPASGSYASTYFNSTYDIYDAGLITIPQDATGQGKVDTLCQTYVPNRHLAALLVNDTYPGGSDGFEKTAITCKALGSWDILLHESGHVVAGLGDEYTSDPLGGIPPVTDEPNTTQQTNLAQIKWRAWIPQDTPIPTPASYQYSSTVGLFRGARYSTNWFRPMQNCRMNSNTDPFCDVCREAIVLALYRKVQVITNCFPTTNLSIADTQALTFSVSLLRPATHALSVQWFQDEVAIPGATNTSCTLTPRAIGNGNHRVKALIKDTTAWVRNDPTNSLSRSNTWYMNVSVPWIQLNNARALSGSRFTFQVAGSNAPLGVVTQGSTNLMNWVSLATNSATMAPFSFSCTNTISAVPWRFFRAVTPGR